LCAGRLQQGSDFASIYEIDRWIEDDLIPGFDTAVYLDPGAEIALDVQLAELRLAVVDDRDLHSLAVKDDRIGRYQNARRLAWDMELDNAVGSGSQSAIRIRDVDFGQQR